MIDETDKICRYSNILVDKLPMIGKIDQYHAMSTIATLVKDKRRSVRGF